LLSVAVCSAAAPARATDVTWIDDAGGSFSDEADWVPDLPFSSDVPEPQALAMAAGALALSLGWRAPWQAVALACPFANIRVVPKPLRITNALRDVP
jgi:hypothetical protein